MTITHIGLFEDVILNVGGEVLIGDFFNDTPKNNIASIAITEFITWLE